MNAVPGAARRRRTAGIGAIAVAAALLTSSCAAGRVAQTIRQRPSIDGANVQVGSINVRNLAIAAPTGNYYPKGSALKLIGVFVNNGTSTDLLTDISSASVSGWGAYPSIADGDQVVAQAPLSTTPSSGATSSGTPAASRTVRVPANSRASYGVPDATGSLVVVGTKATIYPGTTVRMTLTFARAGTVTVQVPVQITTNPAQASIPAPSGSAEDN